MADHPRSKEGAAEALPAASSDQGAAPAAPRSPDDDPSRANSDSNLDQKAGGSKPAQPPPVTVDGVILQDGQPMAVETVWAAELHGCSDPFSVDFVLSNGLTVVVDHPSPQVDNRWLVVAKDANALARYNVVAYFEPHAPPKGVLAGCRLLLQLCASPIANDLSAMVVLIVAMILVSLREPAEAGAAQLDGAGREEAYAGVGPGAGAEGALSMLQAMLPLQPLLRGLMLVLAFGSLLMRGARKFEEWSPPRRGYSLSVKVSKVDDRDSWRKLVEDEGVGSPQGRLKRTLSEIFLVRKSAVRDVAPVGHSLISAVTTSFLGCIAPLATEFERREERRDSPIAIQEHEPSPEAIQRGAAAEDASALAERSGLGPGVNLLVAAAEAELPETVERSQQLERKSSFRRTPPEGVRSRATTPPPMSGLPPASVGATPASGGGVSFGLTVPKLTSTSPGLVDGAGVAGELELRVGAIIEAFATTKPVVEVLGPSLILFLKNDEGNVRKLRKAWSRQIEESLELAVPHNRCASLRGLLETEKATGIHKPGGILADPSAAMALLWMRRSLQFLVHLLHELCEPGTAVSTAIRAAYDAHLEPYHGWVLKQAYNVALNGVPKRHEALQKFYPRLQPHERHEAFALEARECVVVLSRVVDAIRTLFDELDLEDVRKAPWI